MPPLTLQVTAPTREYRMCPVHAQVPTSDLPAPQIQLVDEAGVIVPGQIEKGDAQSIVHWIVPHIARGQQKHYTIVAGAQESDRGVRLTAKEAVIDVHVAGEFFTAYQYADSLSKPFLHPLTGPPGPVTRLFPMEEVEGETTDHVHHKGCWVAWGDVGGSDIWSEGEGHGWAVHREFAAVEGGPVFGRIMATNDWLDSNRTKIMEEQREYRFYNQPASARGLDMMVRYRATEGPVRFGDTKEGGICSVRVATSMDASGAGCFVNAYGAVKEDEGWGRRAPWCDYFGPVGGVTCGVAIMDHPHNFRYPTYWHVRNYGLMTANPFGLSAFLRGAGGEHDGSYTLPKGEQLTFRYRVFVHAGDTRDARVADQYHYYINPPVVTLSTS